MCAMLYGIPQSYAASAVQSSQLILKLNYMKTALPIRSAQKHIMTSYLWLSFLSWTTFQSADASIAFIWEFWGRSEFYYLKTVWHIESSCWDMLQSRRCSCSLPTINDAVGIVRVIYSTMTGSAEQHDMYISITHSSCMDRFRERGGLTYFRELDCRSVSWRLPLHQPFLRNLRWCMRKSLAEYHLVACCSLYSLRLFLGLWENLAAFSFGISRRPLYCSVALGLLPRFERLLLQRMPDRYYVHPDLPFYANLHLLAGHERAWRLLALLTGTITVGRVANLNATVAFESATLTTASPVLPLLCGLAGSESCDWGWNVPLCSIRVQFAG